MAFDRTFGDVEDEARRNAQDWKRGDLVREAEETAAGLSLAAALTSALVLIVFVVSLTRICGWMR